MCHHQMMSSTRTQHTPSVSRPTWVRPRGIGVNRSPRNHLNVLFPFRRKYLGMPKKRPLPSYVGVSVRGGETLGQMMNRASRGWLFIGQQHLRSAVLSSSLTLSRAEGVRLSVNKHVDLTYPCTAHPIFFTTNLQNITQGFPQLHDALLCSSTHSLFVGPSGFTTPAPPASCDALPSACGSLLSSPTRNLEPSWAVATQGPCGCTGRR